MFRTKDIPYALKDAIDAVATAAEDMSRDPIHGGDQWLEFADRLRGISESNAPIRTTQTDQ